MAKARRSPFAAAERFLGFPRGGAAVFPASTGGGVDDLPDLAEADVWYAEHGPAGSSRDEEEEDRTTTTRGSGRMPRRAAVGGLSRAFGDAQRQQQVAASAPVEVPAWSSRFAAAASAEAEEAFAVAARQEDEAEESNYDGGGWVPPHVYLARRQARASVVEGAGRTLKGRDMSRVRDAVWSRTGFDG